MPLFKRKPFALLDSPKDLKPNELLYQVRFTKEIFKNYQEYLKRLNLYRQRVWTCKVTGKQNLTYEEALVSEFKSQEKIQNFPKELIAPVLNMIQFSTLNLSDLVEKIWVKMQEELYEGLEIKAIKENSISECKILKIIQTEKSNKYEIGWLDKEKKITKTEIIKSEDLIRKKPPVSRNMIRVFIRDSCSSQNAPWVLNEDIAKKYDICMNPPEELKGKFVLLNGIMKCAKENKRSTEDGDNLQKNKRKKSDSSEPVKYPIEDLDVKDDVIFAKRPPICREFRVPMESVGDLLSVWDFCASFAKLLHLYPFSLSEFESAICHREGNINLIFEVHSAIINLLMEDEEDYFKKRAKITPVNWTDYLCDFLEREEYHTLFKSYISTIKRGRYNLLDTEIKLKILSELVEETLMTGPIREKLEEQVKKQTALRVEKREKLEEQVKKLKNETVNGSENAETGQFDKEKSLAQKYLEKEMEKLNIRTNPLGKDRNYNRYWFFKNEGRVFVESSDSKQWGYYTTKDEFDALIGSLNTKGIREKALKKEIEKFYQRISSALEKRKKEENQKMVLEEAILRRSTRVQAQPKDNPAMSFLKYSNKWKEA